ncbi:MAG: hypothetical protein ACD_79C00961G0006 [uncultured bacterium]|nr:MAG: hypothetical protein ACD_79C00961G0006 [uncultured bacterium]
MLLMPFAFIAAKLASLITRLLCSCFMLKSNLMLLAIFNSTWLVPVPLLNTTGISVLNLFLMDSI